MGSSKGSRPSAGAGDSKPLTSMDVWNKADEMAEYLVSAPNSTIAYAKVNRKEVRGEGINRDYYSISKNKRRGRKTVSAGSIPLGYYDNLEKKYVAMQSYGLEATDVFAYMKKHG